MFKSSLTKIGACMGASVIALGLTAPLALALPPGGAGADTPGTSSSISPSTVEQCGILNFAVNGFPPGEIVNIKIDDGAVSGGDASIQGQGVIHQQAIDSSGTAQGSLQLPCDLPVGEHHLRYLASEQLVDGNGNVAGTKGYTNVGDSRFTVIESAAGGGANTVDGGAMVGGVSTNANQRGSATAQGTTRGRGAVAAGGNGTAAGGAAGNAAVGGGTITGGGAVAAGGGATANGTGADAGGAAGANGNKLDSTAAKAGGFGAASNAHGSPANGGIFDKNAESTDVALASSQSKAVPYIGAFVGGAILLVGMTAINTWLYVQRRGQNHNQ